jgi:tRNA(Met) cytidine acetyltransferase
LIDAHYQTSQDDLQRLLDAPEIECFILTAGNNLIGVAQIVKEGGEPFNELADSVANCSRRVKGHLVAQNITSSYNNIPFLLAQQWRISRIAIHPEHQRKGFGNQLINYVEQHANLQNIKFLTASFGCNSDILRFWQHNQFSLAKLSAKPEVSSGEHSGICIKPLTVEATQISVSILKKFHLEMHYQMDKNFQYVSADTLIQILLLQPNTHLNIYEDMEILWQFAMGKRAYSTCKRLLKEYLIVNPQCLLILTAQQQELLVATLLQNLTDKYVCANFNFSGKKHIEEIIKKSFKKILQTNY